MTKEFHIASQYLAAAAISFLPKEADDSHTNLGWDEKTLSMTSRDLREDGLHMALSYVDFSVEFRRKEHVLAKIPLSSSRHGDNIKWLTEVFRDLLFEYPYVYDFHYSLPYEDLDDNYVFSYKNESSLKELSIIRNLAFKALSYISLDHNEPGEVRTWPHHFDTGTLLWMGDLESIGIGLAMPDTMIDEYYFYVSGWKGHEMQSTQKLRALKNGKWMDSSWKGAVLPATGKNLDEIMSFFTEAMSAFELVTEKVA